jgi:hypothetical protein
MILRVAAGTAIVGFLALAGLAVLAYKFHWQDFWPNAGQPYATALAGLAAISAAAIALHNGRSQLDEIRAQREQDQLRWEDQRRRDDIKDLRARFSESTRQLADASPAVRRSGAYARAALAQDWSDLGDQSEVKVCMSVLAAYVAAPNPTVSGDDESGFLAGEDGPIRALIVALLSKEAGPQFQDIWGNYTLLHYADLRGVAFTAPINNADLFRADLRGADFKRAPVMQGINLSGAKLVGANLEAADLQHADLGHADLTRADMTGVTVNGANLRFANLTRITMPTCHYDKQTLWPDGFTPPPHPLGEVPHSGDGGPPRFY